MNSDLHVALSLWLNAFDNVKSVDGGPSDMARMRKSERANAEFRTACDELYAVADIAVEESSDGATETQPIIMAKGGYVVPPKDRVRVLLELLLEWDEAAKTIRKHNAPSKGEYARFDLAETNIRRFLASCKRNNLGV